MAEFATPAMLEQGLLLTELDARQREILATRMSVHRYEDGETVVREGELRRTLFLLVKGRLAVSVPVQGGEHETVTRLRPGQLFGTGAFVEGTTRAATIVAEGPCLAVGLEPEALEALLESEPAIVYQFMRVLFIARHEALVHLYEENEQLTNYIMKVHGRY